MRQRSLRRTLLYGALVMLLAAAAAPVVYIAAREGIDAVGTGDGATALQRAGIAVAAALLPVVALAVYAHWLSVTVRPGATREPRVPTLAEDWFLGAGVVVVLFAGWPILTFSYEETQEAWRAFELAAAVCYGLLGAVYVAFAALCVKRYWDWLH